MTLQDKLRKLAQQEPELLEPLGETALAKLLTDYILAVPDEFDFDWVHADEVLGELERIPWLVRGVLKEGGFAMFFGDGGAGKSYSSLHLGTCVASGKEWLGHETLQKTVLVIDAEGGKRRTMRRWRAVRRGLYHEYEGLPMYVSSVSGQLLTDENYQDQLREEVKRLGAGLLILDPLQEVRGQADERSETEMQPILTFLRDLANKTNCAVIVIHHSNKAGGYRGTTALRGSFDVMYKVELTLDVGNYSMPALSFLCDKNRDGALANFYAQALFEEDEHGDVDEYTLEKIDQPPTGAKTRAPSERHVLLSLEAHGPLSVPEIMKKADICSPDAARKAVYRLADQGLIYRTNANEPIGVPAIYDLKTRSLPT